MKVDSRILAFIVLLVVILFGGVLINTSIKENGKKELFLMEQEAKRKEKLLEAEEEENRQMNMDQCMEIAFSAYTERWDSACKALKRGKDCRLDQSEAKLYDTDFKNEQNNCLKRFGG